MTEHTKQEMFSMYAHQDLIRSLDEMAVMDLDWVDLDTLLDAQDKLAQIIGRKQRSLAA